MDREVKDLIEEAIGKLKAGRTEDALLVLERCMRPKFDSRVEAWSQHHIAMRLKATA